MQAPAEGNERVIRGASNALFIGFAFVVIAIRAGAASATGGLAAASDWPTIFRDIHVWGVLLLEKADDSNY